MPYIPEECGKRIAKLRILQDYTQERLAEALNIDRTHLSKIEAGSRTCSIDLFIQFSAFFGVSLDYIILGKKKYCDSEEFGEELDDIVQRLIQFQKKSM